MMERTYSADEILTVIRKRCGIADALDRFVIDIAGINTELEKLDDKQLIIRTDAMEMTLAGSKYDEKHNCILHMVEIIDTVYKSLDMRHPIEVTAFLCAFIDESKKTGTLPFCFVLKVFKDRQGLPDNSDRFTMIFEGTEMELESLGEDRIGIRTAGVEVVAASFIPYLNELDFIADSQLLYENYNAWNASRMTVLEEIRLLAAAEQEFNSVIELLLTYFETILIKRGEYQEAAGLIAAKTWQQPDTDAAGQAFRVYSNPLFAI